MQLSTTSLFVLVSVGAAGCSGTPAVKDGLALSVAPLDLPSVSKVCYDLEVTNGPGRTGDVVWSRGTPGLNGGTGDGDAVCSDRFGNGAGGDISYVAPCDADGPGGQRTNSVTLWFDGLYDDADGYIDPAGFDGWQVPCVDATGVAVGCTLDVLCSENADTPVEFNFTVMRDANQGFFDIAVNFEDIFCSAKVDCRDALLHDGDVRAPTVVVGFACTAGESQRTTLHVSDLVLSCDGMAPTQLSAAAAPGQQGPAGAGVFEWAVYQGDEELTSNGAPIGKCFWNRAIGLDRAALAGKSCRLTGVASASSAGVVPPSGSSAYPLIRFDVEVLTADGSLCAAQPLNGDESGVQTDYLLGSSAPTGAEALAATMVCSVCGSGTDTTCDGVDDDCDGVFDEDYVPVATQCGVGVCVAEGLTRCVGGVVVEDCVPGSAQIGVHSFDDDSDVIDGSVFVGQNFLDVFTGVFSWWAGAGGVDDSGYWYGIANPLTTYAATQRHYSLAETVSARTRILDGRIEASFKTIGGQVRAFAGTTSSARLRWFISARSSDVAGQNRIWVAKEAFEWNPNDDTNWSVHGIDVVYENFIQWSPFVSTGYVGTRAAFEDTARNVTLIGVFSNDASMNFDVHLHSTWSTRQLYAMLATGTEPVRMGWDDVTYIVDEVIDDNCNALDDDCDGGVDEDYVGLSTTCGVGACSVTVSVACVAGVVTAVTCTPSAPAPSETCGDGIDNNCDGATDEGC